MKPEAILTAAEELLLQIENSSQPANEIINAYTRSRRYIGSKDRRTLTDLVWNIIRHHTRIQYHYPDLSLSDQIKLAADTGLSDLEYLSDAPDYVNWEVPEWLVSLIPSPEKECPALLQPAQTILRANGNRIDIQKRLRQEGIDTEPTTLSPYGLRLNKRANLKGTTAYKMGLIEVQDEGSQCVAIETGIKPGDTVLDYCAGAGGKSLIFAQMMRNQGQITAHDISDKSLHELIQRAQRAHATCIQVQKPLKTTLYDHVVVDAPCSGTGTWRRCPDMRWKLTQSQLNDLVRRQADILKTASAFVKDKGHLSYMTCSLTRIENLEQIRAFLAQNPSFQLIRQKQFSPARTQTDGLFIAVMQKTK